MNARSLRFASTSDAKQLAPSPFTCCSDFLLRRRDDEIFIAFNSESRAMRQRETLSVVVCTSRRNASLALQSISERRQVDVILASPDQWKPIRLIIMTFSENISG